MAFDFLNDLADEEKRELLARLSYELSNTKNQGFSADEMALWTTLAEVLPNYRFVKIDNFVASFGRARYRNCSERLEALLGAALPQSTRRPVRMAIRALLVKCVVDYLHAAQIAVSAKSVLSAFDHLEFATDRQYPGYLAAKIIHKVLPVFSS